MEKENITPEEKLLKIIESGQAEKRKIPAGLDRTKGSSKKLSAWFKNIRVNKETLKFINLRTANRAFIAICILVTVFSFIYFLKVNIQLKERLENINSGVSGSEKEAQKKLYPALNTQDVLAQAKNRNMFTFLTAEVRKSYAGEDISEKVNKLKLVGIIWSDQPQAMIENTKEQKTYLLGLGDNMAEIRIKKILRDKVILDIEGKEWELR